MQTPAEEPESGRLPASAKRIWILCLASTGIPFLLELGGTLRAWSDGAPNASTFGQSVAQLAHVFGFLSGRTWAGVIVVVCATSPFIRGFRETWRRWVPALGAASLSVGLTFSSPSLVRSWEARKLDVALKRGISAMDALSASGALGETIPPDVETPYSPGFRESSHFHHLRAAGSFTLEAYLPSHLCGYYLTIYYSSTGAPMEVWATKLAPGWYLECH